MNNTDPPPQVLEQWFLDLLACPACPQRRSVHLDKEAGVLVCACGRYAFPVNNGVPVLLVEEAVLRDPNANPEDHDAGTPEASSKS
ncbi:MAG: Trm112 family protein [Armatimonadetes bacterium]|nr:Trm112 family protein [Armatimonadota bacterium]MDE2206483.1 Trm112 family protein [Armatimonadota bacterium]